MLPNKGKNQQYIREQNRALILKLICTKECLSRIEIAQKTGLTKMTVTNVINDLIGSGLIKEGMTSDIQTVGRKPIRLHPNENSIYSLGIYISRDYIKFSILTLSAYIIKETTIALYEDETSTSLIRKLLDGIDEILEDTDKNKICGIGIACIGPLDINNGIILDPTDFHGISNVNIKKAVEEKTGMTVVVNNDMNAAALAEQLYGKGRGKPNFIYLGITNGIGSGIITNGSLYTGENGFGGEIGHTTINFDGPVCTCGKKGCLEAYASIPVILKRANAALNEDFGDITFARLISMAKDNNTKCIEIIDSMCLYISTALINAVNILDCSSVYLGHEAALGGEYLTSKIENYLNKGLLFKSSKHVNVEISKFGEQSPVIGSGIMVFDRIFSGLLHI